MQLCRSLRAPNVKQRCPLPSSTMMFRYMERCCHIVFVAPKVCAWDAAEAKANIKEIVNLFIFLSL